MSYDEMYTASEVVKNEILRLYDTGIQIFYAGGAFGFDMVASIVVLNLKAYLPNIHLIIARPCLNHNKMWPEKLKRQYNAISARADEIINVTESEYTQGCMQKRNRFLVDNSSVIIAWYSGKSGGTAYTVNYAAKQGLNIINLYNK